MNAVATIFLCSLDFFVLEAMSETRIVLIFFHIFNTFNAFAISSA